jgi:hypothetical protein
MQLDVGGLMDIDTGILDPSRYVTSIHLFNVYVNVKEKYSLHEFHL